MRHCTDGLPGKVKAYNIVSQYVKKSVLKSKQFFPGVLNELLINRDRAS